MKKNSVLKTAALVGAMTATGAVATTTAHADTASATAQQSANTADQQLSNLKSQQTANENQLAAQNEAQYNFAANSANSQITKLQDQLKSQQASQAAQDQPALKSGTAQINSAASSATASENAAYSSAVASQSAANQKELANAAQHIVTPAQKAQQESAAKSAYDKSKADLDAQHSAKSNQIKADYDAAVKKATDEAKANQTTAEQRHTQEVQDATKAVNDAQNKVNNLTQLNQQKQTELTNAKNKLDQVKKNNSSDPSSSDPSIFINSRRKINLSSKYINVLKDTTQYPDPTWGLDTDRDKWLTETPTAEETVKATNIDLNNYDPDEKAKNFSGSNQYYTPLYQDSQGALIPESSKKLTVYAAYLINQLRTQAGYPLVHVNQKYIDYGYQLMHIYEKDIMPEVMAEKPGEDIYMEHDAKGFQNFAKTHNVIWIGGTINGIGLPYPDETKTFTINGQKVQRLSENFGSAAEAVDGSLMDLLINDSTEQFGHARTLLGVTDSVNGPYVPYLALNTDFQGSLQIMIFFVRPNAADQVQDLDVSENAVQPNPGKTTTDSAKTLQDAQSAYDTAYAAAQSTAKELVQAKSDLASAQAKLADLQKSQGTSATDRALQAKLNDLTKTCDAAMQKENDSYNTVMNKLNADCQAKLDAIKKLPTNVDELKAQQAAHLADMKKAHDQKLADIQANAQKQITALKDKLAHSHDAENQPLLDQIAKIKADLKTKEDNLNDALATLKAHDAAYEQLKAKLYPTNNVEAAVKGDSNSYVANGSDLRVTFPVNNQTGSTNMDSNTLPQTGNNNSAVVALGAIASMLGLGMVAKKREY